MFSSKAFIVAVFCVVATAATSFKSCGDYPVPTALRLKGCDAEPCTVYRGEDAEIEGEFIVVADTDNLRPLVKITTNDYSFDYQLPQQDGCESLVGTECPVKAGQEVTYKVNVPILKAWPPIAVVLEFAVTDNNENIHGCFRLDVNVVTK